SIGAATASVTEWKSCPPRIRGARPTTGSNETLSSGCIELGGQPPHAHRQPSPKVWSAVNYKSLLPGSRCFSEDRKLGRIGAPFNRANGRDRWRKLLSRQDPRTETGSLPTGAICEAGSYPPGLAAATLIATVPCLRARSFPSSLRSGTVK